VEYRKPELVLAGQAESLVLGAKNGSNDPGAPSSSPRNPVSLEFED
jgi:hypothetical protein